MDVLNHSWATVSCVLPDLDVYQEDKNRYTSLYCHVMTEIILKLYI